MPLCAHGAATQHAKLFPLGPRIDFCGLALMKKVRTSGFHSARQSDQNTARICAGAAGRPSFVSWWTAPGCGAAPHHTALFHPFPSDVSPCAVLCRTVTAITSLTTRSAMHSTPGRSPCTWAPIRSTSSCQDASTTASSTFAISQAPRSWRIIYTWSAALPPFPPEPPSFSLSKHANSFSLGRGPQLTRKA